MSARQANRKTFLKRKLHPPRSTLFPYTTLFRSSKQDVCRWPGRGDLWPISAAGERLASAGRMANLRSEEHTSELQSHSDIVCRLLLEKKKRRSWPRAAGPRPRGR